MREWDLEVSKGVVISGQVGSLICGTVGGLFSEQRSSEMDFFIIFGDLD